MKRRSLLLGLSGWLMLAAAGPAEVHTNKQAATHGKPTTMSEQERAELAERVEKAWARLPLEAKLRLMNLHRALREMPPEERKFIHDRVERFLMMSPEERERLRRNKRRWEQMTPEQRQQARERFEQKKREFEARWRQQHPGIPPPPFPPHKPGRYRPLWDAPAETATTNFVPEATRHRELPTTETEQPRDPIPQNP